MPPEIPIRPDFSAKFQVKYCLVMTAGSVLTTLILYLYLDRGLGESYFESLVTLSNLEQALPSALLISFVIQLILILLLSVGINLFVSHKIAGPVYRYEHLLNCIRKGDLRNDVRTRDNDQLKSMVTSLNGLLGTVRRLYASLHAVQGELDRDLERISRAEKGDFEALRRQIDETRRLLGVHAASGRKEAP